MWCSISEILCRYAGFRSCRTSTLTLIHRPRKLRNCQASFGMSSSAYASHTDIRTGPSVCAPATSTLEPNMLKTSRLIAGLLVLMTTLTLTGCDKSNKASKQSHSGELIKLSRSESDFLYRDRGTLIREYRLFGVNANPMGSNNRDDYVESFGAPLLTTHLLVANYKNTVNAKFKRAYCEQESAENGLRIVVIAQNPGAQETLDELASKQGQRICARLSGKDLEFHDWLVRGQPIDRAKLKRMTLKQSGLNFGAPFLVDGVTKIPCD